MGGTGPHRESAVAADPWNVFGSGASQAARRSALSSTAPAVPGGPDRREPAKRKPIGEILVEAGVISVETRDRVLDYQEWKKISFGTALLETGGLSEQLFLRALSVQYSVPGASPADLDSIPPGILALVKSRIAERHSVVPFRKVGRTLHVAMTRPDDEPAIRAIALLTGLTVVPHVAIALRIALAIEKHYGVPAASHFKELEKELGETPVAAPVAAPVVQAAPLLPISVPETPAPKPPPAPPPWRQLTGTLCEARNPDQVAIVLLDFLWETAGPAALFRVRGDEALLWKARPATHLSHGLSIPIPQSPLLASLRDATESFVGPCPDTRVNRQLLAPVGGHLPGDVVVTPVNLNGRTVLYIVFQPGGGSPPFDGASLRRLAKITATALGLVALHRRLRSV